MPADALRWRAWIAADVAFLWDMLFLAIHVRPEATPPTRAVLDEPNIAHYLRGFGERIGDDAQVCEDARQKAIGAAWCRHVGADDPGYGYVADDVPELSMAVRPEWRGQGIGRRLVEDLLVRHPTMSLSVDDDNTGAAGLYRSLGFVVVDAAGGSTTMLRRGAPPPDSPRS